MPIAPGRPASAQARILAGIEQDIRSGKLAPGDSLPPVRALAATFRCDPVTAQRACRELERLGAFQRLGNGTRSKLVATGRRTTAMAGAIVMVSANQPGERPQEPGWSVQELYGAVGAAQTLCATIIVVPPEALTAVRIAAWRQDGLLGILAMGEHIEAARAQLEVCQDASVPLVAVDYVLPGLLCDRVGSDHHAGGRMLAEHLIAQGRRRLATLWAWMSGHPDDRAWAIARQAGIAAACATAGLHAPVRRVWVSSVDHAEADRLALLQVQDLLAGPDPPDALLVHTDGSVPPVIRALEGCGKRVHQDIAVAGYDHYASAIPGARPCATVDKRNADIGAEMVQVLIARNTGRPTARRILRLLEPRLIT